jgi:dTDP-4-dehydrorhamnose reductase
MISGLDRPSPRRIVRVLVTGAGGLLGGRVAALLGERGFDVVAARHVTPAPVGLPELVADLTREGALRRALDETRPEAVVHAAVVGRADRCEQQPELAHAVNVELPGVLARLCRDRSIRLIALSTDLVFDGTRPPYGEHDPPGPLGVYGRTKLAGEEAVLAACPGVAVVRVSLVAGRGHGPRGTATETVAWASRSGRPMRLFTDEHRTPVDPESVADAVARLLRTGSSGRFHVAGPERLSRYELGLRVARVLGLPAANLVPVAQASHGGPDRRPPDVSFSTERARRELGWQPRSLEEAVASSRLAPDEAS